MGEGLRRLHSGDFNNMSQRKNSDGIITITLSKRGEGKAYKFRVRNLYKEDEKLLSHEVILIKGAKV